MVVVVVRCPATRDHVNDAPPLIPSSCIIERANQNWFARNMLVSPWIRFKNERRAVELYLSYAAGR